MATLQGASGLKARLRALKRTISVANRTWGKEVRDVAVPHTPARTGKTRKSYRVQASQTRGIVLAAYTADFIDAGVVRHPIAPKKAKLLAFEKGGRTVFARKVNHPGYGARPYRQFAADEGFRRTDPVGVVVKLWNDAD